MTDNKDSRSLRERRDEFERGIINDALAEHGGNVKRAARALGLSRTGLYKRIRLLGITLAPADDETATEGNDGQEGSNEV